MERPYDIDSLAQEWAVSRETVRSLCLSDELAYFKIGHLYRIPRQAARAYECRTRVSSNTEEDTPCPGDSQGAGSHFVQTTS